MISEDKAVWYNIQVSNPSPPGASTILALIAVLVVAAGGALVGAAAAPRSGR